MTLRVRLLHFVRNDNFLSLFLGHRVSLLRCTTCVTQLVQQVKNVPAKNPKVNVVLEKPLYGVLRRWAKRDGVSLSLKVRDLVKAAVEAKEDQVLARLSSAHEQACFLRASVGAGRSTAGR